MNPELKSANIGNPSMTEEPGGLPGGLPRGLPELVLEHNCPDSQPLQADVQTIASELDVQHEIDFEDVDSSGCVQLKPKPDERPKITLKSRSKMIKRLSIVSENKIFEIFLDGQYHTSVPGKLMDDFEDTKVYTFSISLPFSTNMAVLQIPDCHHEFWIFKIKAFLLDYRGKSTIEKRGNFNLDSVDQLLQNKELSKNARDFKNVFQLFQSNTDALSSGNGSGANMTDFPRNFPSADLLNSPMLPLLMMNGKCLPSLPSGNGHSPKNPPKLDDLLKSSMIPGLMSKPGRDVSSHTDLSLNCDREGDFVEMKTKSASKQQNDDLKQYLDDRFAQLQSQLEILQRDSLPGIGAKTPENVVKNGQVESDAKAILDEEVKTYIDSRFEQITERIDRIERDTNIKLDLILLKLNEKSS